MALSTEDRQRAAELADELYQITGNRWHPDGKPKTFLEIEQRAAEVSDFLATLVIQKATNQKTNPSGSVDQPSPVRCPQCESVGKYRDGDDDEPMVLQTDQGEVEFIAKGHYCRRCRRSFFPSVG
ncbi:MAG: hypothetical protein AAGC97_09160 [Planctomycetota bacterium]